MKYNRHIVFVTPGFPRDESDTACMPYLQDYFRALNQVQPDWRISIVTLQYPYRRGPYEWHGLEVHAMGGKNRKWAKPMVWRRTAKAIRRLHRTQRIDILHSFWLMDATRVAAKVAASLHIPHIASSMGQDVLPSNRYLRYLHLDKLKLIALCEINAAQLHATTGRHPDVIIPWGIASRDLAGHGNERGNIITSPEASGDLDASGKETAHQPFSERTIDLLAAGSLIPLKRYDRFIRLVRMVADEFPQVQAMLIGDGPLRATLEAQARELGLENHLRFAGSLPREEVLATMRRTKVFVHCSESEGFGMVLAEALASGAHLVATPVGCMPELLAGIAADKCAASEHTFGLAQAALQFLRHPVDGLPRDAFPISQTVARHIQFYGLDD